MSRYERAARRLSWKRTIEDRLGAILALAVFLLGAPLLRAHHGRAPFDTTRTVRMQGTVTGLNWVNPHAIVYASLRDKNGQTANWRLDLGSLRTLTRYGGWTENTVKPGEPIIVQGYLAKDGSPRLSVQHIWLPGGRSLAAGPDRLH